MGNFNMSNTKIWAITIVCIVCGLGIYFALPSVTPLFVAMILAYIIHPLVKSIQNRLKLRHKVIAVILALVCVILTIVIIIGSMYNVIVQQAMIFIGEFGYLMTHAEQLLDSPEILAEDSWLASHLEEMLLQLLALLDSFIMSFLASILGFILGFTDVVIVLILLFLFLLDGPKLIQNIINYIPEIFKEHASNFFNGIHGIVWGYLRTMIVISILFGTVFGIILFSLGLPFSGLLGALGAILNMIPYIGSIISGAIAVIVALIYHDVYRAMLSAALIIALNIIQGNIIAPLVLANKLRMHPIFVITSLLVCNYIWGIMGMFVAVPLLGLARLFMREIISLIGKLQ